MMHLADLVAGGAAQRPAPRLPDALAVGGDQAQAHLQGDILHRIVPCHDAHAGLLCTAIRLNGLLFSISIPLFLSLFLFPFIFVILFLFR